MFHFDYDTCPMVSHYLIHDLRWISQMFTVVSRSYFPKFKMSSILIPPVAPDFFQCSNQWNGITLPSEVSELGAFNFALRRAPTLSLCNSVTNRMAASRRPKAYIVGGRGDYSLPWQFQVGQ